MEVVPTLDRFFKDLPFSSVPRIDLWRLGDRLLTQYIQCTNELMDIDQEHRER